MLGELFTRYGSDKNSAHSYGPFYEELLEPIREKVTSVLEVGIASGASLRAWRDWFPNALIVGLDHHADLFAEPRIECVRANSLVREQVDAVLGDRTFDLIVDDGGHWLEEQLPTWENLFHRVRPGGWYVVEDLQSDGAVEKFRELGAEIFDRRSVQCRGDDILALFRKPE